MVKEWVAETTCEERGMLIEAGGIYPHRRIGRARRHDQGEAVATCPRCGQRFAATEDGTPEENRDLHFEGDADIPSICG